MPLKLASAVKLRLGGVPLSTPFAGVLASRQYPGLKMTIEFHPGMGHTDVMGTSVVRGLRTLYAK